MPRLIPFRLAAACALALVLVLSTAARRRPRGTPVDLRVVGGGGKILAEEALSASTTSIKTSPKALCFGKGTGGSGKSVTIEGPTALGVLGQAAKSTAALRPLLVTDYFVSEFGLGLCGIGKAGTTSKLSWYLKVNHKNPNRSGETVKLHAGDEVLWALAPYPYPNELSLVAPSAASARGAIRSQRLLLRRQGETQAGRGSDGDRRVGADRRRRSHAVTLAEPTTLIATHGKDIPSNRVAVCVGGVCPWG